MDHGPATSAHPLGVTYARMMALLVVALLMASPIAAASNGGGPYLETISGEVFDERGMPKEGVLVKVEGTSLGTATDEDGRFMLTGTDLEGEGTLVLSAEGYMTARIGFHLEDGGSLQRSVYLVEIEEVPGTIEGLVQSFDGVALSGALVTLAADREGQRALLSDEAGRFRFEEVPPMEDPYILSAEAVGFSIVSREVHLGSGKTIWVELHLRPEIPIELIQGRVVDERGLPLPGAVICVEGSQGSWYTDLDGRYVARVEGQLWGRAVSVYIRGYRETASFVHIPEVGVAWANFTLRLVSQGSPETLWVQVVNQISGEPVENATVTIEGHDDTWTTDPQGLTVVVSNSLQGRREVRATRANHTSAFGLTDLEEGGTGALKLEITRASNAVNLHGHVVDVTTSLGIPGASVSVDASGILWVTVTDANGRFEVYNLPPSVSTRVTAFSEGYKSSEAWVKLDEYVDNDVVVYLEPMRGDRADVEGEVSSKDGGGPVEGALVTLWREGLRVVRRTDAEGRFHVEDIDTSHGDLHYLVEHQEYVSQGGSAPMPVEGAINIRVGLEPLAEPKTVIRGHVLDPDGFSIEDARVSLRFGQSACETRTVDGLYELYIDIEGDLEADLSATGEGYGWHNQTPTVSGHKVNWANFSVPLDRGHSNILGRVVSGGGRPLEDAEVMLTRGGAFFQRASTAKDGTFAFRLVPSSSVPYQLSAVLEGYDGATVDITAEPGRTARQELALHEDIATLETLQGRVVSSSGLPMASAIVRVDGLDPVLTDGNGSFVIVSGDLEGPKSVSAIMTGFETATLAIDLPPGGIEWVKLTLRAMDADTTYVSGRVVRASDGRGLEDATVQVGMAGSGRWTFSALTGPDGSFTFHGVPRAWGGVVISISKAGFHGDSASTSLSGEGTWVTFSLRKIVVEPENEPAMTVEQKRAIGVGVSATLAALAAIAATEVGRVALLGLLLVPLYTKIKREKVMDHFVRGRIYEYICNNPGVNYSAIRKRFELTNGTVTYHLSMLERQEFIRSKQDGIYKRYFQNGGGKATTDVEPMSVQLNIAKAIKETPGMTQKEIAKRLGTSKQLVSYHVRRMLKDGQLETKRIGRSVKVYPNQWTPE